ncbi:hypothetical protein PO909_022831 [Leuciscus waleckii]
MPVSSFFGYIVFFLRYPHTLISVLFLFVYRDKNPDQLETSNPQLDKTRPRRTSPLRTLTSTWAPPRRRRLPSPSNRSLESSRRRSRR